MDKIYFRCDYSQYQSEKFENAICIPLTKGMHALIDEEDFDKLEEFLWSARGYLKERIYATRGWEVKGKAYFTQIERVIISAPKGFVIDHINGNTLDNRKCNLRICTISENCKNRRLNTNNTSGSKGV